MVVTGDELGSTASIQHLCLGRSGLRVRGGQIGEHLSQQRGPKHTRSHAAMKGCAATHARHQSFFCHFSTSDIIRAQQSNYYEYSFAAMFTTLHMHVGISTREGRLFCSANFSD